MKQILITLALIAAAAIPAGAKDKYVDPYKGYDEAVFMDMDLDSNLETPAVGNGEKAAVKRYMNRLAKDFAAKKYIVDMLRDDEVMLITIPTDELFLPNDTTLMPSAGNELKHFLPYFRTPGKFKVILAVHSDDTGSEPYLYSLTEKRVLALYDYFDAHAAQTENLMGYPLGPSEPLKPNTSIASRGANRRVEIFIVPGPVLVSEAKSGR